MVDVILATYNGEKFLAEQIDSILAQTYKDIRVIIRDDESTDDTKNIILQYQKKYPNKIIFIDDDLKCCSSRSNFMTALSYSESEYVMFADQDDYWLPNKIERTLCKMNEVEQECSQSIPILVFCSYIPVDQHLNKILDDKNNRQEARYLLTLSNLLVQNYVHGCLMMINRQLAMMMGKYENGILMHDWWAALLAAGCGKIMHFNEELMLYRQHSNNVVGAVNVKSLTYRTQKIFDNKTKLASTQYLAQAKLLLRRNEYDFTEENLAILKEFIELYEKNKIGRIISLIRGNYLKSDLVRIIGQLIYI